MPQPEILKTTLTLYKQEGGGDYYDDKYTKKFDGNLRVNKKYCVFYPDGSSYYGYLLEGEPKGEGILTLKDGVKIEGFFNTLSSITSYPAIDPADCDPAIVNFPTGHRIEASHILYDKNRGIGIKTVSRYNNIIMAFDEQELNIRQLELQTTRDDNSNITTYRMETILNDYNVSVPLIFGDSRMYDPPTSKYTLHITTFPDNKNYVGNLNEQNNPDGHGYLFFPTNDKRDNLDRHIDPNHNIKIIEGGFENGKITGLYQIEFNNGDTVLFHPKNNASILKKNGGRFNGHYDVKKIDVNNARIEIMNGNHQILKTIDIGTNALDNNHIIQTDFPTTEPRSPTIDNNNHNANDNNNITCHQI